MAKPGVMFYFEIRPCIKRLSLEEKGALFEAILDYGEYGTLPEVDGVLGVAWDFIRPRIDLDSGRYDDKVTQSKYAVAVREAKKKGLQVPSFEQWQASSQDNSNQALSDDSERYPNSKPNSNSESNSNSKSISNSTSKEYKAGKPPAPARQKYGSFGWVRLTQEEYNRLLTDFGETEAQRCIAYIDEAAQSTGNKNKWRDWNLVIRKCHRESWGLSRTANNRGGTPLPDYGGGKEWSL